MFPLVFTIVFFLSENPTIPFEPIIKIIALPLMIITFALMCCFLSFAIYLIVSLIIFKRKSIINSTSFVIILNFIGIMCGLFLCEYLKDASFKSAVISGENITAALWKYHSENGTYPYSLNELVPKYLTRIPETGMRRYPYFDYKKEVDANKTGVERYEIRISFVDELGAWTYLLYRPRGKRPNFCDPVSHGWMYCIEND